MTAPTDHCFDPGQKTMFIVSYVMIVVFHPDLNIERIIIQRSYAHAPEQLTSCAYSCYECYYCRKFFLKPETQKRHMENCSGVPGVIHNFYAKSNLPFVIYFDFETTAPTDHCFDPGQKTMFVVS